MEFAFGTTQRGYNVYTVVSAGQAMKCDLCPVRRPRGTDPFRWVLGQPEHGFAAHSFYVQVIRGFAAGATRAAVPGKSDS